MDSEDVLDWGANEDDEVITFVPRKDAATLSGAESLLALASGPGQTLNGNDKSEMAGEDKDTDVVSLGGDDDDMGELQAYQTRTNLGGVSTGEAKSARPTKQQARQRVVSDKALLNERSPSPPRSALSTSASPRQTATTDIKNNGNISNGTNSDGHFVNGKNREESSFRDRRRSTSFSESARPASQASILPPPGTHGLPPKPVSASLHVPYVRPSHPSITSASTMAPLRDRDRDRDSRRHASPRRAGSRHYSPDRDSQLAPDWEMCIARDGSNDPYYYNSKTGERTWDRREATGHAPPPPSPPRSSYYPAGRRSPGYDDVRRGRSSRIEPSSGRALSPNLSYNDRHYSPPKDDYFVSRPERGGDPQRYQRTRSPAFPPSHSSLRRDDDRGRDRDRDIPGYAQHARSYDDRSLSREPPSIRRGAEIERPRSPSPGRNRYEGSHRARGKDSDRDRVSSSKETRPKELRPDSVSGPYENRDGNDRMGSSPHYRTAVLPPTGSHNSSSAPQYKRAPSPQRDDRYILPNSETNRARNLSPPHRPPKRLRSSKSPPRTLDHHGQPPSQSHPTEWAAPNKAGKTRQYAAPPRDRPPHMEPILIPSAKYMEREENQRRELERSYDTKRQKTTDDPDSASARRALPDQLDSRDARDNGMPVQLDRDHSFDLLLEDHIARRSQPQIDGPRSAPVGPRRRDNMHPRREMDSYRPDPSSDMRLKDDFYPERPPRGPDRDRMGGRLDLPTGPRAMESDSHRRDAHYYRQSIDGPSTNDSISDSRGGAPPLPIADNKSRQPIRGRRDEGPRDNGEDRYAPSVNNARYDTFHSNRPAAPPPGLSGPNTIPLKPRFGDSYRPDEQGRRDRLPLPPQQDAKRASNNNSVGESYRPLVGETSQASRYSPGLSPPPQLPPTVVDRTASLKEEGQRPRQRPNSRFRDIEGPPVPVAVHDPKGDAQMDGRPDVAFAGVADADGMMVDNTLKPDISTSMLIGVLPPGSIGVESNNVTFPSGSGNPNSHARRRSGKHAQRSEQSSGDPVGAGAGSRPIHGLPPKPNVRPSSLLDRLSNPGTVNNTQSRRSPTLRDRVGQDMSSSSKTSATAPQATNSTANVNARPSLRDRLDSNPEIIERSAEDNYQRQGNNAHGNNNNSRNNRSRKGRGQ